MTATSSHDASAGAAVLLALATLLLGAAWLLAGAAPALARSGSVESWYIPQDPAPSSYSCVAAGPHGAYAAGVVDHHWEDALISWNSPANRNRGSLTWDYPPGDTFEMVNAMASDPAGNVAVAGVTASDWENWNAMVIKASSRATLQWAVALDGGSSLSDTAEDVVCDAAGNVYVTGARETEKDSDVWTVKLAATTGKVVWQAAYDGGAGDSASALCLDAQGNVYVTGESRNVAADQAARGNSDVVTIKYDRNGVQQWVVRSDVPGPHVQDSGRRIALGRSGALFVGGTVSHAINTARDFLLIRLSTSGREIWQRTLDSRSHWDDHAWGLQVSRTNSAYMAGTAETDYATVSRGVIARWNSAGKLLWEREQSPAGGSEAAFRDLVIDGAGTAWCAGWTTSTRAGSDYDGLVCRYDAGGRRLWATAWDSADHDSEVFYSLTLQGTRGLFAAGSTRAPNWTQHAALVKLTR